MQVKAWIAGLAQALAPWSSEAEREARLFAAHWLGLPLRCLNLHLTDPCPDGGEQQMCIRDRSMGAGRWQIFRYIKLPSATGFFFSGLKVSASYAVVGAVVAEWLGGFDGLGVYMTRVRKAYAFDKMFAVIVFISIISLLLIALVNLLQKISMPWERLEPKTKEEE